MINSKLSVAIHILAFISSKPSETISSELIANSVNTNPVVIRRISGLLKKKGLLTSRAGVSGATLLKSPSEITLLDIYRAVQTKSDLFALHEKTNPNCPIGSNIQPTLKNTFSSLTDSMEKELAQINLHDIMLKMHLTKKEID